MSILDRDVEQMKATLVKRYERGTTTRPRFARPARAAAGAEIDAELDSLLESEPAVAKLGALLTRRLDERRAVLKRARA